LGLQPPGFEHFAGVNRFLLSRTGIHRAMVEVARRLPLFQLEMPMRIRSSRSHLPPVHGPSQ
jgi:hypothetical protein